MSLTFIPFTDPAMQRCTYNVFISTVPGNLFYYAKIVFKYYANFLAHIYYNKYVSKSIYQKIEKKNAVIPFLL